jgi:hypothetical protein
MDAQLGLPTGANLTVFACLQDNLVMEHSKSTKLYQSTHQRPQVFATAKSK